MKRLLLLVGIVVLSAPTVFAQDSVDDLMAICISDCIDDRDSCYDLAEILCSIYSGSTGCGLIGDPFRDECDMYYYDCLDECVVDTDEDGVINDEDMCPESNFEETVILNDCESGVENLLLDGGCTMLDLIEKCKMHVLNHGKYVSCVTKLINVWKKSGLINNNQTGVIQSCAAKSTAP